MMKNTLFILFLSSFLIAILAFGYYVRSLTEASNSQWVDKGAVTLLGVGEGSLVSSPSTNKDRENDSFRQVENADSLKNREDIVSTISSESKRNTVGNNNEQGLTTKRSDISLSM